MAASDHLGGQFTEVHRGIFLGATGSPKIDALADRIESNPHAALRAASKSTRFSSGHVRSDRGAVGLHWSTQQDVADEFGRGHWRDDHLGVTIHGEAGPASVLPEGAPMARNLALTGETGGEHEITMRPGGSVRVTGLTVHRNGQSTYHPLAKPKDVRA